MREYAELPKRQERGIFAPLALGVFIALVAVATLALLHPGGEKPGVDQLLLSPDLLGHTFHDVDPQTKVRRGWRFDHAKLNGKRLSEAQYRELYGAMESADGSQLELIFIPVGRYAASYEPVVFQTVRFWGGSASISEASLP